MARRPRPLTLHPNTGSKVYRMLRSIVTTAVDDGLLAENPVHIRGAARESIIDRPLLTWDQVAKLADAIEPRFSALVWLAASTGLRFGELSGLIPDDLDLHDPSAASVRVHRALAFQRGRGAVIGAPKTDSAYRSVSIPEPVVERLVEHCDQFVGVIDADALVFMSVRGRPLANSYFAPFWRRARAAVGLNDVRFHDLRHLAGTEAASAGASLREVMARMGHAPPRPPTR
jgi:integrase